MTLSSDKFADTLCEKLIMLRAHAFLAIQQSRFFKKCKQSLETSEVVVCANFSENYAFVLQDAAQGFHWNNSQCTIHPFVIYHKVSSSISYQSYVVISDCLNHDTTAVYLYQKGFITFLKSELSILPKKIEYFTDGAASQYKILKIF